MKAHVFSLSRFFHGKEKALPCWLAGRFYPGNKLCYQLTSQNLSIQCKKTGDEPQWKTGDWIAVQLLSKKNKIYQTAECRVLSSCLSQWKTAEFSYENKGQILQDWQSFLTAVKDFFCSEGLAYASTPGLVPCPGTEPHLMAFETSLLVDGQARKVYLPTSPEMHLKKLLCQDWTDFFEIKKCYRNGELSPIHQAELTILEWYRAFYTTQDLIKESYRLLSFLQKKAFFKISLPQAKVYTVRELFKRHLGFSLTPQTSRKDMLFLVKDHQLVCCSEDHFEDLFFLIFLNKIEIKLSKQTPVFVCDYPPQLRAFSRLTSKGWADRFELYWRGMELANAFYEVIDPREQKTLFEEQMRQRKDDIPFDSDLVSFMRQGMPPVSGIAMGLDRLFLAIYKKEDLKETRLFPL